VDGGFAVVAALALLVGVFFTGVDSSVRGMVNVAGTFGGTCVETSASSLIVIEVGVRSEDGVAGFD
jgi:hypothetical protein